MMSVRVGRAGLALVVALLTASCGEGPLSPNAPGEATLNLHADVGVAPVNTLVVEVTAEDIPVPLVFNLEIVDGVASGSITVPAGSEREITVRAFDASGVETHRGSEVLTIVEGTNETVSLTLIPLMGDQPIDVALGSVIVTVNPTLLELTVGESGQITATVVTTEEEPVEDDPVWASTDPEVALVDGAGNVTAQGLGEAEIVASYAGVAALARVLVVAGN